MKSKICFKIICFQDIYNFESEYQFKKFHKEEYLIDRPNGNQQN